MKKIILILLVVLVISIVLVGFIPYYSFSTKIGTIKDTHDLVVYLTIFLSTFAAFAFYFTGAYVRDEIANDDIEGGSDRDRASQYFSLAMLVWSFTSIFLLLYKAEYGWVGLKEHEFPRLLQSFTSSINSVFILLGFTYLKLDKNISIWPKFWQSVNDNPKLYRIAVVFLGAVICIADYYLFYSSGKAEGSEFTLEFIFTIFTSIIIGVGLYNAYEERGMKELKWLAMGLLVIIVLAHHYNIRALPSNLQAKKRPSSGKLEIKIGSGNLGIPDEPVGPFKNQSTILPIDLNNDSTKRLIFFYSKKDTLRRDLAIPSSKDSPVLLDTILDFPNDKFQILLLKESKDKMEAEHHHLIIIPHKYSVIDYANFLNNILFKLFLIPLLFALETSWLGWINKKVLSGKLEEVDKLSKEKDNAIQELKQLNIERKETKGILEQFVEIVRPHLVWNSYSVKEVVDFAFEKLQDHGICDYGFCIGIKNRYNEVEFIHLYENGRYNSNKIVVEPKDKSFAAVCIETGKDLVIPNLENHQQLNAQRNKHIFPDSESLIYIPLRSKERVFGVLGIQSRIVDRSYDGKQIQVLKALGFLLERIIDPNLILSKEEHFLERLSETNCHIDKDFKSNIEARPQQFRILEDFMSWEKHKAEMVFKLKNGSDKYFDSHPINTVLKGMSEKKLSLGTILLLAIAACQQINNEMENSNNVNPFLDVWQELYEYWEKEENKGHTSQFQYLLRNGQNNLGKGEFKTIFRIVFQLFKKLFISKSMNNRLNLKGQSISLSSQEYVFSFRVGLDDPQLLENNINENLNQLQKRGAEGLRHDVSGPIAQLWLWSYALPFQYDIDKNKKTLQLTFGKRK